MRVVLSFFVVCLAVEPALAQQRQGRERPQVQTQSANDDVPENLGDEEQSMSFWMKHKLDYSKSMLESLTMGDFAELEKTAKQMQRMSRIEGFVRRANTDYQTQLKSFDLSTKELARHAARKNPEGATLAFNQMTASCVACHTLLRSGID